MYGDVITHLVLLCYRTLGGILYKFKPIVFIGILIQA